MHNALPQPDAHGFADPAEQLGYYQGYTAGQRAANIILNAEHQAERSLLTDTIIDRESRLEQVSDERDELAVSGMQKAEIINALTHTSERDRKTGLLNSEAFAEHVKESLNNNRRKHDEKGENYLLFLDLDDFKAWNSLFTETANDGITLIPVADTIGKHVRQGQDYAGRWGGEEFVVFVSDIDHDNLVKYAERLKSDINSLDTPGTPKGIDHLGVSIGFAQLDSAEAYDEVLRQANLAKKYVKYCMPGKDQVKDASELTQADIAYLKTLE